MAFFNKLFGAKNDYESAKNSEIKRIGEILENGSGDELKQLETEIRNDLHKNDSAMAAFADIFVWYPKSLSTKFTKALSIDYLNVDNIALFYKGLEQTMDKIAEEFHKEKNKQDGMRDDGLVDKLRKLAISTTKIKVFLENIDFCRAGLLDENKFTKTFYGKDKADDLQVWMPAVENMLCESGLFNEDGKLDENITFWDLLIFAEAKWLWFKLDDKNLEANYLRIMREKLLQK